MDLTQLDTAKLAEEGAVLEVLHPTQNTPLGIKITLAGQDSEIYRKAINKIANRRVKRLRPGQPIQLLTAEEQEENALALLVACTLAWEGIKVDGEDLTCTLENVRIVYQRFPWLREQVDTFIADRNNFLAG